MTKRIFNVFSIIALVLTIVGALNWLLVGAFDFNLVTWATMGLVWLQRTVYVLVGIAGVFMLVWLFVSRFCMMEKCNTERYDYRQ